MTTSTEKQHRPSGELLLYCVTPEEYIDREGVEPIPDACNDCKAAIVISSDSAARAETLRQIYDLDSVRPVCIECGAQYERPKIIFDMRRAP